MTVREMLWAPLRYGVPTLLGACGRNASGEGAFSLGFEWPSSYARFVGNPTGQKRQNERRQLDRLRADFVAGGKSDPFTWVEQPDGDPPDFLCTPSSARTQVGVEFTQLTFPERIGEQVLFEKIKSDVLAKGRGQLAHLRGFAVTAAFFDANGRPRLPARDAADNLLEALRSFEPPSSPPITELAKKIPAENMPAKFAGGEINAFRLDGDPGGAFHRLMRWELLLSASGYVTSAQAWEQLCTTIAKKDVPGNEILVLSCASPTTPSYLARPADTLLARALVDRVATQPIPVTEHLKALWLHSWPERSVHEMTGGCVGSTLLCGQRFAASQA